MARTDDDSWDITERRRRDRARRGVGASSEATSECRCSPTRTPGVRRRGDRARLAASPQRQMAERIRSIAGYAASRTKWFDEFFIAAGAGGIEQAVILAAGLDARAWRLPWNDGQRGLRDRPAEGARVQDRDAAQPRLPTRRSATWRCPSTFGRTGRRRCRKRDSTRAEPTAWAAEGLLPYLPAAGQDLLFERITDLSAPGSRDRRRGIRRRVLRSGVPGQQRRERHAADARRGRRAATTLPTSPTCGTSRTAPTSPTG